MFKDHRLHSSPGREGSNSHELQNISDILNDCHQTSIAGQSADGHVKVTIYLHEGNGIFHLG